MRYALSREAEEELAEAAEWYEGQQPGLGGRFLEAIQAALELIAESPRHFPRVFEEIHRALAPRPFSRYQILFVVREDSIDFLAVFHSARDPKVWQSRA